MRVTPGHGKPGEGAEEACDAAELEAESLTQRDVALNVGCQHDTIPGHGWAISDRRPKSTLA